MPQNRTEMNRRRKRYLERCLAGVYFTNNDGDHLRENRRASISKNALRRTAQSLTGFILIQRLKSFVGCDWRVNV